MDQNLWAWNEYDEESWVHGTFYTKEEAIQDALRCREWIEEYQCTDSPIIYIGKCEYIPLRTDVNVYRILEELDEKYSEETLCDTYIYDGVTKEEMKWLEDKLADLMSEFHQKINLDSMYFTVVDIEEISLNDYKEK